jgi:ABC-type glutathione transport system ATPase component
MIVNLESSPPLPVVAPPLLEIRDLDVRFYGRNGCTHAVNNLSYTVRYGGSLAIIGASGSGKSVSCRAVLNLLSGRAVVSGSVRFNGRELLGLSEGEIRAYRGAEIAMVFQDTDQALNPTMRIGEQIAEAVRLHAGLDRMSARHRAVELLDMLKMPDPEARAFAYPHELSGGMRQRVMIAIALAGNPKLLIADEPTRALDVTTQAEILGLLKDMQRRTGMAVILVSHDLLVAANFADDIVVMRAMASRSSTVPPRSCSPPLERHTPRCCSMRFRARLDGSVGHAAP